MGEKGGMSRKGYRLVELTKRGVHIGKERRQRLAGKGK